MWLRQLVDRQSEHIRLIVSGVYRGTGIDTCHEILDKKDLSPRKPQTKEDYKLLIKGGICCGVALCISTNLQQVGILMGASAEKQVS